MDLPSIHMDFFWGCHDFWKPLFSKILNLKLSKPQQSYASDECWIASPEKKWLNWIALQDQNMENTPCID